MFLAIFLMTDASHRQLLVGSDFRGIFTGPYIMRHGAWAHLYDVRAQLYWQQQYAPEVRNLKTLLPFLNPAFVALGLVPLTLLSFTWAYVVWGLANVGLFALVFFWCFRLFRSELQRVSGFATPLFLLVFSWIPFWVSIMQGQFSLILLLALCMSWTAHLQQKQWQSGLWLALFYIRPHLLIVPALLFLLSKQYKVLQGLVCGVLGLVLIGFAFGGFNGLVGYVHMLGLIAKGGEAFATHPSLEPTLKSVLHVLFGTNQLTGSIVLIWLTLCAVVFSYLYWRQAKAVLAPFMQWALIPLLGILLSPHTNYHDLSLVFFSELLVIKYIVLPRWDRPQAGSRIVFWSYIVVGVQIVALGALLSHSAIMACALLVCTLYLLYFEYRQKFATGAVEADLHT